MAIDNLTKFGKGVILMGSNAHIVRSHIEALYHLWEHGAGNSVLALPPGGQLEAANISKEDALRAAEFSVAFITLLGQTAPSGTTYGEIISDLAALDNG